MSYPKNDITALILRQLNRRVGPIAIDLQEKIKALSLEKLNLLGEDRLDFRGWRICWAGWKGMVGRSN
ncbi:MAG: DUF4351 domain-containing protein [Alkalinema sp. RU_4_3]|nr:DUF4351 domain-containing protein [Alkalinema sp. RU_4_3]